MPRIDLVQLRGSTAATWTSLNPVLAAKEPGIETDTGRVKFGDGANVWANLSYADDVARTLSLPLSQKGAANGVASLTSGSKVYTSQLPVGTPNGIASLDPNGKVTVSQLPAGTASGLATLDANGKVPSTQLAGMVAGKMPHRSLTNSGLTVLADSALVTLTKWVVRADDQGDACGITHTAAAGTLTVTQTGLYAINVKLEYPGVNTTGWRDFLVYRNPGNTLIFSGRNSNPDGVQADAAIDRDTFKLTAGDSIYVVASQNSGGSMNFNSGSSRFVLSYLGA